MSLQLHPKSPVVTGNIVIHAFDPFAHSDDAGGSTLTGNGIDFAASGSGTGLYLATGCYAEGDGTIGFMSEFGTFSYTDDSGNSVTIEDAGHPVFNGLSESDLEDWGDSYHALLSGFPSSFSVLATDGSSNALIIAAGAAIVSLPAAIPALSPMAMALLAGMLAIAAMIALRFR